MSTTDWCYECMKYTGGKCPAHLNWSPTAATPTANPPLGFEYVPAGRIADLERELENVQADYRRACDAAHDNAERAVRAEADSARLREALEKYGDHLGDCRYWKLDGCDCGLRAARAAEKGEAK